MLMSKESDMLMSKESDMLMSKESDMLMSKINKPIKTILHPNKSFAKSGERMCYVMSNKDGHTWTDPLGE